MPQRLKKILEKSPIIPTATAGQLARFPDRIEALYMETVQTHMSIGDTAQYEKRLLECVLRNATTFNGAVVGDYGFGKTSMLIYLWKFCLDNKIMAVPPYQWDKIDEHIMVVHSWISYKLRSYDKKILNVIDGIYEKYKMPTIENEAKRWAVTHKVDINTAIRIVTDIYESGKMSLDVKAEDIINYCEEITNYLQESTEYKGLVVITDELQQTIIQLNPTIVYEFLFDMTNGLISRKGNYGFIWGLPITTQADLQRSRSDILDRLNSNKFFVKLFDIYDASFPTVLWGTFCKYLDIEHIQEQIVEKAVLTSIGQICDGDRRDLGNGPRSVISAFNRIAGHYIDNGTTYTVLDLVEDCLDDQIVLGDRSEFKKRLNSILMTPGFEDKDAVVIKIIGAFPNGIPDEVILQYSLADDVNELIRKTGGLGKVVVKDINSYILKVMRKSASGPAADTVLEDEVRKYFSLFSPDKEHENKALKTFNDLIQEDVFKYESGSKFANWKLKEGSIDYSCNNHVFRFEGSFNDKYPLRKLRVITRIYGRCVEVNPSVDPGKEDISFTFSLYKEKAIQKRVIRIKNEDNYLMNLSLYQQVHNFKDHKINDIVPDERQSPIFFLGLIDHLRNSNIPNDETKLMDHLISVIKQNIFENLFNEELLGEVHSSDIELNNQGERLVKDLFNSICENKYPEYATLMTGSNWKGKIHGYINALKVKDDNLGLIELRGNTPVFLSQDRTENKQKIARLFGVGVASFESHIADLKSFARYRNNEFSFAMHPLESFIQNHLDKNGSKIVISSKECISANLDKPFIDSIRLKGYTEEEIELILRIMEARQLLIYNHQERTILKVLENKDQLRAVIAEFYQKVHDFYTKLNAVTTDLPVSEGDFIETKNKIDSVETNEQAANHRIVLKSILNRLSTFCANGLKSNQISLRHFKDALRDESLSLKSIIDSDMKDFPATSLVWQTELSRRKIELINELTFSSSQAKSLSEKANLLIPGEINDDESAIASFITSNKSFSEISSEVDTFKVNVASAKDRAKNIVKWKQMLRICDGLNDKLLVYSHVFDSDSYQQSFDQFNEKIADGLSNNPVITLQNYENFKAEIQTIQLSITTFIDNLKNEWESKVDYCKKQLKKITGNEPSWRLRWGDVPAVAYTDLKEVLQNDLNNCVNRILLQFSQMEDDVIYTKEVLGHSTAVKNKNIQMRITDAKESVVAIRCRTSDENVYKNSILDPIITDLVKINSEYGELNKAHAAIIKPTPVDLESEKGFIDLLNKTEGLDLKSLIISYQKECNPNIDLTGSREEVLDIIKSLFLKKQVTIQVKRGKI